MSSSSVTGFREVGGAAWFKPGGSAPPVVPSPAPSTSTIPPPAPSTSTTAATSHVYTTAATSHVNTTAATFERPHDRRHFHVQDTAVSAAESHAEPRSAVPGGPRQLVRRRRRRVAGEPRVVRRSQRDLFDTVTIESGAASLNDGSRMWARTSWRSLSSGPPRCVRRVGGVVRPTVLLVRARVRQVRLHAAGGHPARTGEGWRHHGAGARPPSERSRPRDGQIEPINSDYLAGARTGLVGSDRVDGRSRVGRRRGPGVP